MNGINAIKITEPEKEGLDDVPLEDFIAKIENEILDKGIDQGKNKSEYLKNFIAKKEKNLSLIKDKRRKNLAEGLFGTREIKIKDEIEKEAGYRSEDLKIMDAKWQQEIIFFIGKNNNRRELEAFWEEYDALFDYYGYASAARGEKLKAGILGTLAAEKFFSSRGLDVRYPTAEEDVRDMIDMVASDEKNKTNFLIQIKVRNKKVEEMGQKSGANNDDNNFYWHFHNEEIAKVFEEDLFKTRDAEIIDDYDKFRLGCFKYTREHKKYFHEAREKGYQTKGLFLFVPYSIDGKRVMDIDGEPAPDFIDTLKGGGVERKLALPNSDKDVNIRQNRNLNQ